MASFTKRTDVLPQDLVKTRSREVRVQNFLMKLKFCSNLGNRSANKPVKLQSDTFTMISNFEASKLLDVLLLSQYDKRGIDDVIDICQIGRRIANLGNIDAKIVIYLRDVSIYCNVWLHFS